MWWWQQDLTMDAAEDMHSGSNSGGGSGTDSSGKHLVGGVVQHWAVLNVHCGVQGVAFSSG